MGIWQKKNWKNYKFEDVLLTLVKLIRNNIQTADYTDRLSCNYMRR